MYSNALILGNASPSALTPTFSEIDLGKRWGWAK
jgi:hypothetical protein